MTYRSGRSLVIQRTPPEKCELCGKVAELRPYGPNGKKICFDCGMANQDTTDRAFEDVLDSVDDVFLMPDPANN
jgi:hypothetical protein